MLLVICLSERLRGSVGLHKWSVPKQLIYFRDLVTRPVNGYDIDSCKTCGVRTVYLSFTEFGVRPRRSLLLVWFGSHVSILFIQMGSCFGLGKKKGLDIWFSLKKGVSVDHLVKPDHTSRNKRFRYFGL